MKIIQDGREFYDDASGDCVFTSSLVFGDYDTAAAASAREEFLLWAARESVTIEEFV